MKKVLEIVPHFGFARSFLFGRMKYCVENGLEMHLAHSYADGCDELCGLEGVKHLTTEIKRVPSVKGDIVAIYRIFRYIRQNKIDLIVGHADKGKLLACICGKLTGRKIILFAHGTSFESRTGLTRKLFILLDRIESSCAIKVICVSKFLVELRLACGIDKAGKAYVPHNGSCRGIDSKSLWNPEKIDIPKLQRMRSQYNLKEDDFVIGFCGRLVRDKGIEELVKAFELFKKEYNQDAKLLLIGQKDIRDFIDSGVEAIIQNDINIIKTGEISKSEMPYLYSMMNLFVLPTHRDGFGMCVIEAAAMGVPVMTTNFTGSRDTMKQGFNGEYINLNPFDICQAMGKLYKDKALLKRYAQNSRIWVERNFDEIDVWNSILNCYEEVL